jgi:hypothetical protein
MPNPEDLARQRFKPLQGVYEKVARLSAELAETRAQAEQLKTEQTAAAHRDKQAYAVALSKGEPRPTKREGAKARVALEDCELKAEALALALDAAFDERARLIEQNRSSWRRQSMRQLAKAQKRYTDVISELEAARDALSGEASLITWLDSGASADAASDPLGGRVGTDAHGRQPMSFVRTLEALRGDAAYLAEFPVARDDPAQEPKLELAWRGR